MRPRGISYLCGIQGFGYSSGLWMKSYQIWFDQSILWNMKRNIATVGVKYGSFFMEKLRSRCMWPRSYVRILLPLKMANKLILKKLFQSEICVFVTQSIVHQLWNNVPFPYVAIWINDCNHRFSHPNRINQSWILDNRTAVAIIDSMRNEISPRFIYKYNSWNIKISTVFWADVGLMPHVRLYWQYSWYGTPYLEPAWANV